MNADERRFVARGISDNKKKLPEGWRWEKLSPCVHLIESGSRPKGGVKNINGGIPSLGAEHIGDYGSFDLTDLKFIPDDFYNSMTQGKVQQRDVLLVKDGATTGRVSLVDNNFPFEKASINERVFLIRPKENLCSEFLFYILRSPLGQQSIKKSFRGAAQGGITQAFANDFYFPLPSTLADQIAIASDLERRMTHVEKMRGAALCQKEAIAAMQGAILREVFPYKEGDRLPTGWKWRQLNDICHINPSKRKDFNRKPDELISFVPMEAVDEEMGKILEKINRKYSEIANGYTFFEENDILFAKITPCMQNGKSAIAQNLTDGVGFGSTEFHVLRPKEDITKEWIYFYVRTSEFRKRAKDHFEGSAGQQRVSAYFLEKSLIPLPPTLSDQLAIATDLERKMSELEKARQAAEKQLEAIEALPGALLREVFDFEEENTGA